MSEPLDLDAIRAELRAGEIYPPQFKHSAGFHIWSVLAALDVARAERDLSRAAHQICCLERIEAVDRAEAAEARWRVGECCADCPHHGFDINDADTWEEAAAKAEARIAALAAVHAQYFDIDVEPPYANPEREDLWRFDRDFRRALNGETP